MVCVTSDLLIIQRYQMFRKGPFSFFRLFPACLVSRTAKSLVVHCDSSSFCGGSFRARWIWSYAYASLMKKQNVSLKLQIAFERSEILTKHCFKNWLKTHIMLLRFVYCCLWDAYIYFLEDMYFLICSGQYCKWHISSFIYSFTWPNQFSSVGTQILSVALKIGMLMGPY